MGARAVRPASDDDGGFEIEFDFEEDNFGSDCFGEVDDTTELGVTYSQYAAFPDRATPLLSARPGGRGFTMRFDRQ